MKSLKMLMLAALTILTISVFSQNNTTKSKKELMKMGVMKIQTTPKDVAVTGTYSKDGLTSNLSPKEQMKMNLMKSNAVAQHADNAANKSGKCSACLAMSNLSLKEQMKMTVMDLNTCPMSAGIPGHDPDKCSICGMDLTAVNDR